MMTVVARTCIRGADVMKRRPISWFIAGSAALLIFATSQVAAARPPNFILILCDNLGYGDVACFNPHARQRTARIDQMASRGMKFTHCYAAAPVCTPSRAALMTGCYPRRVGLDFTQPDGLVLRPASRLGLHPDEVTIADILKQRGYVTACIGKWHLGDHPTFLPTRQGFDQYFGIPYSDDMTARPSQPTWPELPLMEGERVIEAPVDRHLLTRRYTEKAIQFIEQNRNQPFFLYLPHAMPGSTPAPFASPAFQGRSANGRWGDAVEEIDWSTGQILDCLDRLNLNQHTLVIWTNDNGAPATDRRGGSNLPLKGQAYSIAEGGMRVPLIAHWPDRIPAGTTCSELITLMDLLPTFAFLAGTEPPRDRTIDGHDIRPLLFQHPDAVSPYKAFYFYFRDQLQAVRRGPWKLYVSRDGSPQLSSQGARLYHLVDDPREATDVAGEKPELVHQLLDDLRRAQQELGEMQRLGRGVRELGKVEPATR
jgi:arylsulfatase A-like enzyme